MTTKILKIRNYIDSLQDGQLFIYSDIVGVPISYTRNVIQKMCHKKEVIRIAAGIFQKPKIVGTLGPIPPHTSELAKVISRKYNFKYTYSAESIGNQLGITNQCVSNAVFVADIKKEKKIKTGRRTIIFVPFSKEYKKFMDARISNSSLLPQWIKNNIHNNFK